MASKYTTNAISETGKAKQKAALYDSKHNKSKQTVPKGASLTIAKKSSDGFYYISASSAGKIGMWIKTGCVSIDKTSGKKKSLQKAVDAQDYNDVVNDVSNIMNADKSKGYKYNISKLYSKSLFGVFGAPYQFMHTTDAPITNQVQMGRTYIDRIGTKMPLLLIVPGLPDFLPSFSKKQKKNILTMMGLKDNDKDRSSIASLLGSNAGRYYSFRFEWEQYYQYVNLMLRYCAICLGIQNVYHYDGSAKSSSPKHKLLALNLNKGKKNSKYSGMQLGSYRWEKVLSSETTNMLNTKKCIAFYLDSETSISESISNSTTSSILADGVNSASSTAKELQFIAGPIFGVQTKALDPESYNEQKNVVIQTAESIFGKRSSKFFGHLDEAFKTIGKGGKLAFPEIWDDSEYSQSYDLSMKFRTPDGDKISWYLNICVPLIHILALSAPRALGPNGYKSPFIVRAWYKGIFVCNMGIVTSCSINKGKEGAWSVDGLPTEVDVQISLKDLYSRLTISKLSGSMRFISKNDAKTLVKNTCLVDYLSNMCGININEPDRSRMLTVFISSFLKNQLSISQQFGDRWLGLEDAVTNFKYGVYENLFGRI